MLAMPIWRFAGTPCVPGPITADSPSTTRERRNASARTLIVARQGANAFAALLVEIVHEIDDRARRIAIGLGEDNVEADGGGAEVAEPVHQIGDHGAGPRPLPQGFQAFFVDVDDDRGVRRGFARRGLLEEVEGSQPQLLERRADQSFSAAASAIIRAKARVRPRPSLEADRASAPRRPGHFRPGVTTWQKIGDRRPPD